MTTAVPTSLAASAFAGPFVLVPITLRALPVNSSGNGNHWADLTADFTKIADGFVLGAQIQTAQQNPQVSQPPLSSGPHANSRGIHLHWALPDGLTHGYVAQDRSPT